MVAVSARSLLVSAVAVMLLALVAAPASAHADFVDADPGPGTGLPQAPGAVVLRFSEPLVADLSEVRVLDEAGDDVTRGPAEPVAGDATAMRRELGLLPPGRYEVAWTTVSPLDGHTLRGRYTFAVGARATPDTSVAAGPVDSEGMVGVIGRSLALAGLATWAGLVVLGRHAVRIEVPARPLRVLRRLSPALVGFGGVLGVLGAVGVAGTGALLATPHGAARAATVLAGATGAVVAGDRGRRGGLWGGLGAVALVGDVASGHAASSSAPLATGALLAIHVVAAGVWFVALGLAVLARERIGAALQALSGPALGAAAGVVLSGAVAALALVAHPRDLVVTGYGRTLLAKVVLVGGMAALGLVHRRRRRVVDRGAARTRRPVLAEAATGALVIVLAATLVSFPDPPGQEAGTTTAAEAVLASLDREDALSLGAASGPFVVGLSVLPPRPGPVRLRVHVVGTDPGDGVREVEVTATGPGGGRTVAALGSCGRDCFAGDAVLAGHGDWRFTVAFRSNRGDRRVTLDAPLPSADGAERLRAGIAAMERLDSVTVTERLREEVDGVELWSDYAFAAPDAMRWIVRGGSGRVALGERGWQRPDPTSPWTAFDWVDPGFAWPEGFYVQFFRDAAAARVVGREDVDGHATTIVAFVQPSFPIWYRVWIDDATDVVRRLEMRTESHLMDHRYEGFDEPVEVAPPV